MSGVEELTSKQAEELVADLCALRQELRRQLEAAKNGARPVELDLPIGRLSRMDALQQQNLAVANRSSLEVRLRQISAALAAQEEGEYGLCRSCDEPIGYPRLKAQPETPFCVRCQGARESARRP